MTRQRMSDLSLEGLEEEELDGYRPRGFLGLADVTARYGIGRRTVPGWVRAGRLPQPVRLPLDGVPRKWWRLDALEALERSLYGATLPEIAPRRRKGKPGGTEFRAPPAPEEA